MPALPISNKDSAWGLWRAGLISAANVGLSLNSSWVTPTLENLAVRKGYNALRLQMGAPAGPFTLNADDVAYIASQGWDDAAPTQGSSHTGIPTSYSDVAQQIDRILGLAKQCGMGVILAVTDFHQDRDGALWQQASLQDALVGFWRATAKRWPSEVCPQIIGFDLLSKPYPDPSLSFAELNCLGGNAPTLHNWRALANRCVAAIRGSDLATPIVVEGIYGGAARGLDVFRNLNDTADRSLLIQDLSARVVYSFHLDAPRPFTHQGVSPDTYESVGTLYADSAFVHCRRWDYYNPDPTQRSTVNLSQDFTSYLSLISHFRNDAYYQNQGRSNPLPDFHKQFGVPLFLGEFGTVNPRQSVATLVDSHDPHRTITALTIESNRVTLTLGQLDANGFRVECGPNAGAWPFTNLVTLVCSGTGTPLDGQAFTVPLTAGQKAITFNLPGNALPNTSLSAAAGVGTLTLSLPPVRQSAHELARQRYVRDVLRMCRQLGCSWGWQFEDNELAGEFNGWRASAGVTGILGAAAAGNTLN